jgi:hypothetical protein
MISKSRRSLGVRNMPDHLDSGYCACCNQLGEVRINIDGVWSVLCLQHKEQLVAALLRPEPAPEPKVELVPEDAWCDDQCGEWVW